VTTAINYYCSVCGSRLYYYFTEHYCLSCGSVVCRDCVRRCAWCGGQMCLRCSFLDEDQKQYFCSEICAEEYKIGKRVR